MGEQWIKKKKDCQGFGHWVMGRMIAFWEQYICICLLGLRVIGLPFESRDVLDLCGQMVGHNPVISIG